MHTWPGIRELWAGKHDVEQVKAALWDVEYHVGGIQTEVRKTSFLMIG